MGRTSIWAATASASDFPTLSGDLAVDVAIIGGGISGLTTALHLSERGLRVAVLEAGSLGCGTTGHSTGNLYATLSQNLSTIRDKWGDEVIRQVAQSRLEAIDQIELNVERFNLPCNFARQPWFLFTTPAGSSKDTVIDKEFEALTVAGLNPLHINSVPLPLTVSRGITLHGQAQFHPLEYVRQLALRLHSSQCQIFEFTPVMDYDLGDCRLQTPSGTVRAEHIVMATHTPKGVNMTHLEMMVYREYGLAATLASGEYPEGIFWAMGPGRQSYRSVVANDRQYLVLVGAEHLTGHDAPPNHYETLKHVLNQNFDIASIDHEWSAQHYHPADGLPYIGRSIAHDRLYIATGFSQDGLTYGSLAGMIIADLILERDNPWIDLYTPRRFTPVKSAKEFIAEQAMVIKELVHDYITADEADNLNAVAAGEGRIVDVNGEKVAAYRNNAGELFTVSPVCRHAGCEVHWNGAEKSWDCPCHGSRYRYDGELIEGPALHSLPRIDVKPRADDDGTYIGKPPLRE